MQQYIVQDNGNEPFIVYVYPSTIEVYRHRRINEYQNVYYILDKKIVDTTYLEIFIGDNELSHTNYAPYGVYPGNSILVHVIGHRYLFIGHEVFSFTIPDDIIQEYYSPVGDNMVPYPYAIGQTRTYFMLDRISISNDVLDLEKDGYSQFYGFGMDIHQKIRINNAKHTFLTHTISKRIE